jgi:hypothetical protein
VLDTTRTPIVGDVIGDYYAVRLPENMFLPSRRHVYNRRIEGLLTVLGPRDTALT